MRIPRFFQNTELELGASISLDDRAVKHVVQVLRLTEGKEIIVFNGKGGEFHAKLVETSKRNVLAKIFKFTDICRENILSVHLAQCVSKGDRFDFALQKSVELGVKEITPIFSQRSQVKLKPERLEKKIAHWEKILLSACEQSGRTKRVQLNPPLMLSEFLTGQQESETTTKLILDPQADIPLSSITPASSYRLLIGPEGGFELKEVQSALELGYLSTKLGKQILRTETAPIAALSVIYAVNNIF